MKSHSLSFFAIILVCWAGIDTAAATTKKKKGLSWKKYHHLCGKDSEKRDDNFDRVKSKTVIWRGKVAEVTEDMALSDHRTWASDVVRLKMDPSDSLMADVRLRIPKAQKAKINALDRGDIVLFKGRIMYLGSRLGDHVVEVEKLKVKQ